MSASARTVFWRVAPVGALLFLCWLALDGGRPEYRHLIRTESKGLLSVAPEAIDRVVVTLPGAELRFARRGGGWLEEGRNVALEPEASHRLDVAVKIMRTSPPIRELTAAELGAGNAAEFGLNPPRAVVSLREGTSERMRLALGKPNPQSMLRYARVNDSSSVYVYSGFIGEEWEAVAGLAPPVKR